MSFCHRADSYKVEVMSKQTTQNLWGVWQADQNQGHFDTRKLVSLNSSILENTNMLEVRLDFFLMAHFLRDIRSCSMPIISPFLSHKNCASIFRQIAWKLGPWPCFAWPRVKPRERGWNLGCGRQRIIESLVKMNSWRSSHVSRFPEFLEVFKHDAKYDYWYDERIYVSSPISGVSLQQNMQDHARVDGSHHNLALCHQPIVSHWFRSLPCFTILSTFPIEILFVRRS